MAVASGQCPSCGAPIEFGVGSSIAKICEYCNATVCRTDRGLQDLGKVAAIANTPSLIAVGDEGTIDGRHFQVMGRVQLDHGAGPWDEYYVAFDHGQSWGWLAYAQGEWICTAMAPGLTSPPYHTLQLEMDIPLGQAGSFRVTEVKTATIASAEGEIPGAFPPGFVRHYADLHGANGAYATLDYGDNTTGYTVFLGWFVDETRVKVTQLGPRSVQKVKTDMIKCPSCGGDVPKLAGERSERLGCPYCGAVSDIGLQQVIAQQEAAMATPEIPIGSRGNFEGTEYICIAYVRRKSDFDGDEFSWDEYLLFSPGIGYRWLVKDEASWMWAMPVNIAELDLTGMPTVVGWGQRSFSLRNHNEAEVDYVLGEVYWKVEVGETTRASDYTNLTDVLSREEAPGEVRWSYSTQIPWSVIAQGFGLPEDGPGGVFAKPVSSSGGGGGSNWVGVIVVFVILLICCVAVFGDNDGHGGGIVVFGGSSAFSGGK